IQLVLSDRLLLFHSESSVSARSGCPSCSTTPLGQLGEGLQKRRRGSIAYYWHRPFAPQHVGALLCPWPASPFARQLLHSGKSYLYKLLRLAIPFSLYRRTFYCHPFRLSKLPTKT